MLSKPFTVSMQSNACTDSYPYNTSFHFKNYLPRTIDLSAGYEVGLVNISYTDNYEKPNYGPVVNSDDVNFFDEFKMQNAIIVQSANLNKLAAFKTLTKLVNFIDYLNNNMERSHMNCRLVPEYETGGKIKRTQMKFTPEEGYEIAFKHPINRMIGFQKEIFQPGEFYNDLPIKDAIELFEKHADGLVGEVVFYKYFQKQILLDQIKGRPLLETLLSEIIGTLVEHEHLFSFNIRPGTNIVDYNITPRSERLILSPFLNLYLGQDKNFYFTGQSSIRVPPHIINPNLIDPYLFMGERPSFKLYVLCNIIQNQFMNGKEKKVLAVLDRVPAKNDEITVNFSPVIYKNVQTENFSQIEIKLEAGNNFDLQHFQSPTVVELHFRPTYLA